MIHREAIRCVNLLEVAVPTAKPGAFIERPSLAAVAKTLICGALERLPVSCWSAASRLVRRLWKGFADA